MYVTGIEKVLVSEKRGFYLVLTTIADHNISNMLHEEINHDDYIIVADENNYEGINMIWKCKVNEKIVRDLFYNLWRFKDFQKGDTWERMLPTVEILLREELDKLCMDGFSLNINGYDYYIDSNNYLSFAMIIDYSNFKEVYNQCYAKDNFNLYI